MRIESSLLAADILTSQRIIRTTPVPAFCRNIPADYFNAIEGNKLYKLAYYLENLASLPTVKRIWSHGSAQSNAMLALSALSQLMSTEFRYVVPYLPPALKQHPNGNLARALAHGMQLHIDGPLYRRMAAQEFVPETDEWIFGEGASHSQVQHGFSHMGKELSEVCRELELRQVFLPSGTGVSASHLAASLPGLATMTMPAYGDAAYLQNVFASQYPSGPHPAILSPAQPYRFGTLHRELWELHTRLVAETGISFDMLYDLPAWACILQHREKFTQPWLYLHQGGMHGSSTMHDRYQRMIAAG